MLPCHYRLEPATVLLWYWIRSRTQLYQRNRWQPKLLQRRFGIAKQVLLPMPPLMDRHSAQGYSMETSTYVIGDVPSTTIDFDCGDLGLNQIEVTATDASGNTATCTATVEVIDDMDPVLICQRCNHRPRRERLWQWDQPRRPSGSSAYYVWGYGGGSDNGSGTEGFTDFTAPVTDAASISFDWVYTSNDTDPGWQLRVFVERRLHPAHQPSPGQPRAAVQGPSTWARATCSASKPDRRQHLRQQRDRSVQPRPASADSSSRPTGPSTLWTPTGMPSWPEIPGGPLSYDNCGITVLAVDVTDVTCAGIGTPIVVTVFASDASGNLASCTSIVTVVDESGPTLECPGDMTVDPGANNLFYELPDYWGEDGHSHRQLCRSGDRILTGIRPQVHWFPTGCTPLPSAPRTVRQRILLYLRAYGWERTGRGPQQPRQWRCDLSNPAASTVNIANASSILLDRAAIYDVNGKLVQTIDLSNMDRVRPWTCPDLPLACT